MTQPPDIAWLKARLAPHISEVTVQGDRPLLLTDPSCCYVTLADHQVFCVDYLTGQPRGRREHLLPCRAGQLLFGVAPQCSALLLSGISGSVVWCFPSALLFGLAATPADRRNVACLIDSYIALLCASLPESPVPTLQLPLRSGVSCDVPAEHALCAQPGELVWVAPHELSLFSGVAPVSQPSAAEYWPLTERVWLSCKPQRLHTYNTEALLARGERDIVLRFAGFIGAVAGQRRAALLDARTQRELALQEAEAELLHTSMRELSALAADETVALQPPSTQRDDFSRVCSRLAPAAVSCGAIVQPAASLERLTTARTRPVHLELPLRHDAGPMLAFLRDRPVALLPRARGYELFDPRDGSTCKLDASLSAQLAPQAHQFYRTLPVEHVRALDLLRFCVVDSYRDLALALGSALAASATGTLLPLFTGHLYDRIIPAAERGLLVQVIGVLLGIYAGSFLFDLARGWLSLRVQTRMHAALEAAVWDRLLRLPLSFFRAYTAGDLAMRAQGVGALRAVLANVALGGLTSSVLLLWNTLLMFYLDARLALTACVLLASALLMSALASRSELQERRVIAALDGRMRGLVLQLFSGITKLRASGAENRAFVVWSALFTRRREASVRAQRVTSRLMTFHAAFGIVCNLVLYLLLSESPRGLSAGEFLAFSAAFSALSRALLELISASSEAFAALPLYERAKPILHTPLETQTTHATRLTLSGSISIDHLSFRYAPTGPLVLDDVCVRIEPGELVAIVGASGSGKSSLLRLLLGFETPHAGAVYYDGQALSGLDLRALRQQIGVVLQNSQLTPGDIYSNIVGSTGLPLAAAWRAARQAALDKDIEAMPMGMHTMLTAGGGALSGGQRQRLLIARALASQPKILLLDEATSALDNHTQAAVRRSLDALRVTRVVIAHRLSTIRNADKIIVLDQGRVVQSGTFDALHKQGLVFGRLARRQLA